MSEQQVSREIKKIKNTRPRAFHVKFRPASTMMKANQTASAKHTITITHNKNQDQFSIGQDAADVATKSVSVQTAAGKQKRTTRRYDEIHGASSRVVAIATVQKMMPHFLCIEKRIETHTIYNPNSLPSILLCASKITNNAAYK